MVEEFPVSIPERGESDAAPRGKERGSRRRVSNLGQERRQRSVGAFVLDHPARETGVQRRVPEDRSRFQHFANRNREPPF